MESREGKDIGYYSGASNSQADERLKRVIQTHGYWKSRGRRLDLSELTKRAYRWEGAQCGGPNSAAGECSQGCGLARDANRSLASSAA